MPAVFQIASRASGNSLWWPQGDPNQNTISQTTIAEEDNQQWWTLQPQDSAQDCLILPVLGQGQAIGLGPEEVTDLTVVPTERAQVWRISRRIANPPYFYLIEGDDDWLVTLPSGGDISIQIAPRTEHANQQWTFLPVFTQL